MSDSSDTEQDENADTDDDEHGGEPHEDQLEELGGRIDSARSGAEDVVEGVANDDEDEGDDEAGGDDDDEHGELSEQDEHGGEPHEDQLEELGGRIDSARSRAEDVVDGVADEDGDEDEGDEDDGGGEDDGSGERFTESGSEESKSEDDQAIAPPG